MEQRELVGVPGVPESALTAEMLGRLPESAPCTMRVRGRGRLALVTVDVEAPGSLSGWLKSGRHLGMVFETVHFAMSAPGEPGTT